VFDELSAVVFLRDLDLFLGRILLLLLRRVFLLFFGRVLLHHLFRWVLLLFLGWVLLLLHRILLHLHRLLFDERGLFARRLTVGGFAVDGPAGCGLSAQHRIAWRARELLGDAHRMHGDPGGQRLA